MENGAAVRKILEASWGAIAKAGIRKFRVSDVASSAKVSVGLVYYHFKDRNGLLLATMEHANRMTPEPGGQDAPSPTEVPHLSGRERVRQLLLADLSGDESSRDNAVVWYEIMGEAFFVEELRGQVQFTLKEWRSAVVARIRDGQTDGSIAADLDAETAAQVLTALIDGLLSRVPLGLIQWDEARSLLNTSFDLVLPPRS